MLPERANVEQRRLVAKKAARIIREYAKLNEVLLQEVDRVRTSDQVEDDKLFDKLNERFLLVPICADVVLLVDFGQLGERPDLSG